MISRVLKIRLFRLIPFLGLIVLVLIAKNVSSFSWQDSTITPGQTPIRKVHLDEIRNNINSIRTDIGLAPYAWTDPSIVAGQTPIKAQHLLEAREAINDISGFLGDYYNSPWMGYTYFDDFSTISQGSLPPDWVDVSVGSSCWTHVVDSWRGRSKVIQIHDGNVNHASDRGAVEYHLSPVATESIILEYSYLAQDNEYPGSDGRLYGFPLTVVNSLGETLWNFRFWSNPRGLEWNKPGSGWTKISNVNINTWYNFKVVINIGADTLDFYVNDNLRLNDGASRVPTDDVSILRFATFWSPPCDQGIDSFNLSYDVPSLSALENALIKTSDIEELRNETDNVYNVVNSITCCGSYGGVNTGSAGSCPGVYDTACASCYTCSAIDDCSGSMPETGWGDNLYGCIGNNSRCYNGVCRTCSGRLYNDGCGGCANQGGKGCWYQGNRGQSCGGACSSRGGCVGANWNDPSNCPVCNYFQQTYACCQGSGGAWDTFLPGYEYNMCGPSSWDCMRRQPSTNQGCGAANGNVYRQCVCRY